MKIIKTLLLISITLYPLRLLADGVKNINVQNGVILIESDHNRSGLPHLNNPKAWDVDWAMMSISLQLYTNGIEKQYMLKVGVNTMHFEYTYIIPGKAKLLIKMADGSVEELQSVVNPHKPNEKTMWLYFSYGCFPVTEDFLEKAGKGIAKIRIEMLTLEPETGKLYTQYRDKIYEKDKIGKQLVEWRDDINKAFTKKKGQLMKELEKSKVLLDRSKDDF